VNTVSHRGRKRTRERKEERKEKRKNQKMKNGENVPFACMSLVFSAVRTLLLNFQCPKWKRLRK
jgi:hypothetical protein